MGRRAENHGIGEDFGPSAELSALLLTPEEAFAMEARGGTDAAVLVPLHGWPESPGLIFTERPADMRRHAGEISFPGGRKDEDDADLTATALREAEEEIGLLRTEVKLLGDLPPTSTFATNYEIHPFIGVIPGGQLWRLSPLEVDAVLELPLDAIRDGRTRTQLQRRGITFETGAYVVDEHLIWGATARILEQLLGWLAAGDLEARLAAG